MSTENSMKTVAIGDIHGHYAEMMTLYDLILKEWDFNPDVDRIIFLGDYVDGGYRVKEVIDQLMKWDKQYPHWQFLFGNHEDMMLKALEGGRLDYSTFRNWYAQGGKATALSYTPEKFRKEKGLKFEGFIDPAHIKWLSRRPVFFEDDKYFYVHAGLIPALSIKEHLDHLISHSEYSTDIIETFLWTRYEFIEDDYDWGKKVIFGHTFVPEPLVMENKIGIDTMPRNKGKLTAVLLPEEQFLFSPSVTKERPTWAVLEDNELL